LPVLAIGAELVVGFLLVAALVGAFDEAGIGIAMSVGAVVSSAVLLTTVDPQVREGGGKLARVIVITLIAAVAGQLLPVPYDTGGLLAALSVSAIVWTALAAVALHDETIRVV